MSGTSNPQSTRRSSRFQQLGKNTGRQSPCRHRATTCWRILSPCLAFHRHDGTNRSTVLFGVSEKKRVAGCDIGELENMTICPTPQGFMLARDPRSLATFLWSPQAREKIQLPPLGVREDLLIDCNCLLSHKPNSPECVVIVVEPDAACLWHCRIGDGLYWGKYDYDIGSQPAHPDLELNLYEKTVIDPIAACRGRFYFNCSETELGVIDFCGPNPVPVFSSIEIDEAVDEDYGYEWAPAKDYLLESNEELYMVRLLFRSRELNNFYRATFHRLDFSKRRWRRVDELGDCAFLLSPFNFAASYSGGKCGLQQNCEYLVYPREKYLRIFNLNDGSVECQKLDEAPAATKAFWMFPSPHQSID